MSLLACDRSSTLDCRSALTVVSSSFNDCISSFEVSSSSFVLCSSSLVDFSSSFDVSKLFARGLVRLLHLLQFAFELFEAVAVAGLLSRPFRLCG